MKTTMTLVALTSVLTIGLATTTWASPPGKGPIGDGSRKPTAQSGTTSSAQHKALKRTVRTGPPGKGWFSSGPAAE